MSALTGYLHADGSLTGYLTYAGDHAPYIGSNGNWYVFDGTLNVFADSGIAASQPGPKGDPGDPGQTGPANVLSIGTVSGGDEASATITGTAPTQQLNLVLPKGDPSTVAGPAGDDGRGIVSIIRTSGTGAPGTTDTYTVTYTDETTSSISVYNGADGEGAGDMLAAVFAESAGVVKDSAKLGGQLPAYYAKAADIPDISGKVDKITGKGLSTEDYTTAEKTKLGGIAAGANNYTHPATHSADIITDGTTNKAYTATEKTKLAGIAAGAEANVNADWNAANGDAQILNKPTIPSALSALTADATHRLVTDTEKSTWDGKASPGLLVTGLSLPTSGYSGSGPYTIDITVAGVTTDATKYYQADKVLSQTQATADLQKASWNLIVNLWVSAANTFHFVLSAVPTTACPFLVKEAV